MKLTKKVIDGLGEISQETLIWDDDLPGFGLRCWPSGRRVFFVQYRVGGVRHGTQRRLRLGVYGVLTLDQARVEAKRVLAKAALGEDASEARSERKKAVTVSDLLAIWTKEGVITNRRTGAPRSAHNIAGELGCRFRRSRPSITG